MTNPTYPPRQILVDATPEQIEAAMLRAQRTDTRPESYFRSHYRNKSRPTEFTPAPKTTWLSGPKVGQMVQSHHGGLFLIKWIDHRNDKVMLVSCDRYGNAKALHIPYALRYLKSPEWFLVKRPSFWQRLWNDEGVQFGTDAGGPMVGVSNRQVITFWLAVVGCAGVLWGLWQGIKEVWG